MKQRSILSYGSNRVTKELPEVLLPLPAPQQLNNIPIDHDDQQKRGKTEAWHSQ
jgi:hypothetical protein